MGFNPFKKIGKWAGKRIGKLDKGIRVKSSLKGTGHFIGEVASNPLVQAGVGLASGGILAPVLLGVGGGALKKGGGLRDAISGGAKGALSYGAGKLVGKIPGIGRATDVLPDGMDGVDLSGIDAARNAVSESLAKGPLRIGAGAAGRVASVAGTAGDLLKTAERYRPLMDMAKAGASAYGAYDDRRKRDRLMRRWEEENDRRRPMRDKGMAMLMDDSRPDLSSVFDDPMAPGQRYRRIRVGSKG